MAFLNVSHVACRRHVLGLNVSVSGGLNLAVNLKNPPGTKRVFLPP